MRRWAVVLAMLLGLASSLLGFGASGAGAAATTWQVSVGGNTPDSAIQGLAYYPGVITIDAGDSITWTQVGTDPHTVTFPNGTTVTPGAVTKTTGTTCCTSGVPRSSGLLFPGQTYTLTFPSAGVFAYLCELHLGQVGVVVVQPAGTPYPQTQAGYTAAGRNALAAALASGRAAEAAYQPYTTPGAHGGTDYHVANGVSPQETTTTSLSGASAHGSATFTVTGPGTVAVKVLLRGLTPGSRVTPTVYVGSCAGGPALDTPSYPLPALTAAADGTAGAQGTMSSHGPLLIPAAGWYLRVASASGATVACGDETFANATVLRFVGSPTTVHVGDQITWTMLAPQELHTVSFLAAGQTPPPPGPTAAAPAGPTSYAGTSSGFTNSGYMFPYTSYTLTFTGAGTFTYRCLLHDDLGMLGQVHVLAAAAASTPVPVGAPATGAGGSSGLQLPQLAVAGAIVLLLAGGAGLLRLRRRPRGGTPG